MLLIFCGLVFAYSKSVKTLLPNDAIDSGFFSCRSAYFGGNETSLAGFDGLAASFISFCKDSFSMREYNDGSSVSTYRLEKGEIQKANTSYLYV